MTNADGMVLGVTQIVDHGSPADRYNIVLVSEGYQASEMTQWATDAQDFAAYLGSTPPYNEPGMFCAFNIYRIDVTSTDSGADDPVACGGTGAAPHTYFDASFCTGGIQRLMNVDGGSVISVVNGLVPQWQRILVVVNSSIYGGAGGTPAVTSKASQWLEIAMHEMGHALYGFADEYAYWATCGEAGHADYSGAEPTNANITTVVDRTTNKWGSLILASTPSPTGPNLDCSQCDDTFDPMYATAVGTFEGAGYYSCGLYRPQADCKMRELYQPFCEVCKHTIRNFLAPYIPIDCPDITRIKNIVDSIAEKRVVEVPDPERPYGGDPPDWLMRLIAERVDFLDQRITQLGEAFIQRGERPTVGAVANADATRRLGFFGRLAWLLGLRGGG